jgi:1-acyl-sn-glycerol-3-phosphate acyltransferase
MNRLRTLIFSLFFYTLSVPIVLAVPVSALFGRRAVMRHKMTQSASVQRCQK